MAPVEQNGRACPNIHALLGFLKRSAVAILVIGQVSCQGGTKRHADENSVPRAAFLEAASHAFHGHVEAHVGFGPDRTL